MMNSPRCSACSRRCFSSRSEGLSRSQRGFGLLLTPFRYTMPYRARSACSNRSGMTGGMWWRWPRAVTTPLGPRRQELQSPSATTATGNATSTAGSSLSRSLQVRPTPSVCVPTVRWSAQGATSSVKPMSTPGRDSSRRTETGQCHARTAQAALVEALTAPAADVPVAQRQPGRVPQADP